MVELSLHVDSKVYSLLRKNAPKKTKIEKKQRLINPAELKKQIKKNDSKDVNVLKFELNYVTTLVETKEAKLVYVLRMMSTQIELVNWLPELQRNENVLFAFIKNKIRQRGLLLQKISNCVAQIEVRKEDQSELDNLLKN